MFGQHWTMTEADIVKYTFNTTVNAAIKIQGQTPENIEELEIAAFHNGVLRGVASPVVETLTGQYVAYLVVYSSNIGELITFKLYDPSIDKEYDTDYTINFTQTVIGEPIDPVIINFYTKHWNYVYNPEENYMALPCIIKVDGNLIDKSNYEIAAFSGNQLRGVANPELEPVINIYKAMLKIDGTNGETISFKLFDVDAQKELETDYTIPYDFDYFAGDVEIEFKNNPVARIGEEGNAARYFATLEAAVAAAQPGETVVLLQDVNLTETLTIEKSITIDLNEKNVTGADGYIVFNVKTATTIENGTVIGNKSGTSSGLIDIYANLDLDGVTIETSKINALRFKAGECTATLTNCNVTGAFKGYGGSVWEIKSGVYKASSTSIDEQLNGSASVSGGTFHYEIKETVCAPGYVVKNNGNGTWTVEYAPAAFVDADNDGELDEGEVVYGNLDQIFANHKEGDVHVVLTADIVANAKVDTDADAHYYFTTNVAGGVTMDFLFADDWNYIQKMTLGQNITLNAKHLLAWTEFNVSGTINTDYLYTTGAKTTITETGVVNANTGDETVQVKNGAEFTVNGTLNTSTLNVWVGESKLVVSGANAKVNASWVDIWDGAPSVTVKNGATLATSEDNGIKASRGGSITVDNATLTGKIQLGHNGESAGELTVTGSSNLPPITLTVVGSTVEGPEGLNVTTNVPDHKVVYENDVYKVVAKVYVAQVGDVKYESVNEAINSADDGAIVQLLPGTIEEYVYPWPESNHSKEKSITILGSENFGTTLTGGMYLGYDDSQCRDHSIIVKGVAFKTKGILVACQKNVTIEGNKFENITDNVASPGSASKNAISVIGLDVNATIKNNVINTTASVGIDLRNIKAAVVEGNTVSGTQHNSMQIQNASAESEATIVNNTFSNWGQGGEGRAMRINGIKEADVNGNVMSCATAPEEFVKVTGSTTLDASANYWDGYSPLSGNYFLSDLAADPVSILKSYYTDAAKSNLVQLSPSVAKIGEKYYQSLAAAFAAAAQTEELTTIELLPVTIEEDDDIITEEKTIKLPATLKNVIVKGADNNTSILKNLTIQNAQGGTYDMSNITFDGVVFDNSNIVLTGWRTGFESLKNLIVKNCIFRNIVRSGVNLAAVHINVAADKAVNGFTFINNVIDGVTGAQNSGIYGQFTGEVIVKDNTINNVAFRPYVIQLTTDDGIDDNFTVTGNTFSGSAAGRAQGLGNNAEGTDAVTLTVSNNIFKGITNAQQICYWNFNEATTTATLEKNYYDIDVMANPDRIYYNSPAQNISELSEMGIFPIYTKLNDDGTINEESLFDPVAYVGTKAFETLDKAVTEVTENNNTIVVIANVENVNHLIIPAGKNVVLDLNGKTISGVCNTSSEHNADLIEVENTATLTIKDSSENEEGKVTYASGTYKTGFTVDVKGNLILESGTIELTDSWSLGFAVDVRPNAWGTAYTEASTFVMNGGKVVSSDTGVRIDSNSGETNPSSRHGVYFTMNGGDIISDWDAIFIQHRYANDLYVNIAENAGTIQGKNSPLRIYGDGVVSDVEINIAGGTFDYTGDEGTTGWVVEKFLKATEAQVEAAKIEITGGTFDADVSRFCAFNYVCTQNTDGTYGIQYKPLEDNAFVISNLHELEAFRDAVNAGNTFEGQTVVLSAGVDLNPTRAINNWEPIGTQTNPFNGTFDGGNNTISNLVVEGENNVGLFGYADNATIKNIKLENVNVKGTDCVGAIAGQVYSTSLIDNCHVSGLIQVEGQTNVGGIVGKYYTKVTNSSVIGDGVATSYVKGVHYAADYEGDNIGGIMGHGGENNTFTNNTVKNITISGTRKVGGIVGVTDQNTDVTNCLVENVNIETTATAQYATDNAAKAGHASIVGSYTKLGANNNGTVTNCVVKNVTFVNNDNVTMSAGPITGGAREGMVDPTGVTASGNLIYMSTITGNTTNMYLMNAVAKIGETKYYTLQEAVDAGNGKTINVIGNTTEAINIADNAVIDLNFSEGVTLNGYFAPFKGNLTINGGTINNTNGEYSAIEITSGELNLDNVNISSARHAVRIDGAVIATIDGGTYKPTATSGTRHAVNVSGAANVTIKDGTFEGPKGTTADSGSAVCVQSGATVTIEGGDFSKGKNATLGVSGTMIVKGGTFDQDVTAYCANGYVCQMNADNKYEVFFAVASITNANGTLYYASLQAAVNAAGQNETTIVMIADAEVSETVRVEAGQKITLDLNGKTIDGTEKVGIALMSYGDLTIKDSTEEKNGMIKAGIGTAGNTVNICKGTFTLESGNIYSKNNAILIDEETATVNINGGTITAEPTTDNSAAFYISSTSDTEVNITAGTMKGFNGILLWNNTKINITGGSVIAEGDLAIQGNGSRDNTEINISGENTIITGKDAAIYHPQGGKLNISGGTITGETGIVVKGGVVTISGGTINGTGAYTAYAPESSGYNGTGDALYVEHYDNSTDSGNYGTPVVTVTGGTFNSTNAKAVASYANPNNASNGVEALANFISGGTFNKVVEESLLAAGYALTENNGMYEVSFADYIVLPDFMDEDNYEDYFGTNTVTDGTNYYATLQKAVEAVVGTESTLYCKPGANVGSLQHAPVTSTLTVYGNDAYVSDGGERDFDLGNTDPNGGRDITADMTLTVQHLDGCGAWGTKATEHTVNLVFENCYNMGKVFITGTTGTLNITMNNCAFEGVIAEALYSNADGAITLTNVDFSNLNKAVNLNHKAAGTQTVTMTGCTFTDCGNDVSADQIPVRVLSSVPGGKSELTVENCTFTGTPASGADILLDYGVGLTEAIVKGTNGTVVVERTENVAESHSVVAANEYSFNNLPFVAEVDGTQFTSLQAAINAADGKTVVVLDNITLTETLTVAAGTTVTLDLNGKTVSQEKECTASYQMIENKGALTIKDSTEGANGKISFEDTGDGDPNFGWGSYTIGNYGTLVVENGTIENISGQNPGNGQPVVHMYCAIQQGSGAVSTTINGGTISTPTYRSIRTNTGALVINGGTFVGQVWLQPNQGNTTLEVNGGNFSPAGNDGSSIFMTNAGENYTVSSALIKGGFFNTKIGSSNPEAEGVKGSIVGGIFTEDAKNGTNSALVHEYFEFVENEDGNYGLEQVLFAQTTELQAGWNWYSSYINLATPDGLEKIQTALGTNGIQIKGNYNNNSSTYENLGNGSYAWIGDFTPSAKQMYMINTSSAVTINVVGEMVDYKETPINLRSGWNWIGYPVSEAVDVNTALADLNGKVSGGDVIKTFGKSSQYSATSGKWVGQLKELKPGEGYMYKSSTSTSFVYSVGTGSKVENVDRTIEEKYWMSDVSEYANNMTVVAMLSIDGEIVKDNYEIAAFVNGECRGSERPIYVEELDAYVLFLTVHGDDVEELTFKYYDVNYGTEYELSNRINYSNDAVVGSVDEPYMFNLDILNIGETSVENISIYPNPTTTGSEINLQAVCDKVEVFNALGVKVAEYTNVDSIDAIETAGVYVIRLTIDNSARNCRLIVK